MTASWPSGPPSSRPRASPPCWRAAPRWRNADGAWRDEVDGVAVTYQQVASAPDLFAHHLARPTFVVLDEIHHAGESATWGTALRAAFDGARHRLALSGTPFRSDARAIPFVRYDEDRCCAPDFVYGYGDAVGDETLGDGTTDAPVSSGDDDDAVLGHGDTPVRAGT